MSDSVTILNGGPTALCYDREGRMLFPGDTVTVPATEWLSRLVESDLGIVVLQPAPETEPEPEPEPVAAATKRRKSTTTTTAADDAADSKE